MATQVNVREIILETLLLITRDGGVQSYSPEKCS